MQPATILLSHDELLYLLYIAKIPSLPGMAQNPLATLETEQLALTLSAGQRGLLSKQLLDFENNSPIVETALMRIILFCSINQRALLFNHTNATNAYSAVLHLRDGVMIRHAMMERGVHTFTLFRTPEELLDTLMKLLSMGNMQEAHEPAYEFELSGAALTNARIAMQTPNINSDTVIERLVYARLSQTQARALVQSLGQDFISTISLNYLFVQPDPSPIDPYIGFIQDVRGWWLMEPLEHDMNPAKSIFHFSRVSSAQVFSRLKTFFAHLLGSSADPSR